MNSSRDPDVLIKAFLEEGIEELPDSSYDVVRSSIDNTRQRVVLGPWREEIMRNYAMFGIAAAALVLVAVIGIQFLPKNGGLFGAEVTPAQTESPTSSPTPVPSRSPEANTGATPPATVLPTPSGPLAERTPAPEALPFATTTLSPGRYMLRGESMPISFEVPAGWWTQDSVLAKGGIPGELETPDMLFWTQRITVVNPDACHRITGDWIHVSTADEIVEALMGQSGIFHTTDALPFETGTLQGRKVVFGGREFTGLSDASDCSDGVLRSWAGTTDLGEGGHPIIEGQVVSLYVFDVDGTPLTLVAIRQADSSASDVAELDSIVRSVRIEP
jgi:hypothetical protein